jgi:uncharacterized protein with von Willebrand factor type A (vWA) domain
MIKIVDAPAELADASLVGHKFARQQRLRDAGVSVPPGKRAAISRVVAMAASWLPTPWRTFGSSATAL